MENKFLDINGVQHLYQKLSLEDYPNNEVLMAVINAIDENKADKKSLNDLKDQLSNAQSDYEESDVTSLSYIKNRPFYEEEVVAGIANQEYVLSISELTNTTSELPNHTEEYSAYELPDSIPIEEGHSWKIYFSNNIDQPDGAVVYLGPKGKVSIYGSIDLPYITFYDGKIYLNSFYCNLISPTSITFVCYNDVKTVLRQLDEKFIPDTIARVSEVMEPAEQDIPSIFFTGTIPSEKSQGALTVKVEYISKTKYEKCYGTLKVQGNSSTQYPKKNFTFKLFEDAAATSSKKVAFKDWGKQKKFCLKANWIDLTHSRNIVSARIWKDVIESRSDYDNLPKELRKAPRHGVIDGFPVKVYCNNIYQGRYTLNIPKDKWMTNMDDELDTHCILCAENYESGCFQAAPNIDGNDWTDELHDEVPETIRTSWTNAISFVMNNDGEDFKNGLSNYFDVQSLIDYYCFSYAICHLDGLGKNQIFLTYDGTTWMASPYDMDSTFGLYWNGASFVSPQYRMQGDYETAVNGTSNLLYEKLELNFSDEIKSRWAELREGALSGSAMIDKFNNFCSIAPRELVERDYNNYTADGAYLTIPSVSTNNIDQITQFIAKRLAYVDEKMSSDSIGDSNGSGGAGTENVVYLRQNYSPAGNSWSDNAIVNWDNGDYVEVKINLTGCTEDMENIISLGSSINTWANQGYHCYYDSVKNLVQVNWMTGAGAGYRSEFNVSDLSSVIIKFTKTDVTVNGDIANYSTDASINTDTISIGSAEGASRSHATYEYIKIVRA